MLSKILIKLLTSIDTGFGSSLVPSKGSSSAAGYDLRAAVEEPTTIFPGKRALIPCGFAAEIPEGYVGLVCPRSGLAVKNGITLINSPGIIDSDYRGQFHVALINLTEKDTYTIEPGERIGQLLIVKIENMWTPVLVDELSSTDRGTGGFGSTGKT